MSAPARDRGALFLGWGSAYLLYLFAYAVAIRLSYRFEAGWTLFAAFTNSLPEAVAAPLVLRVAGRPAASGRRAAAGLGLVALVFVLWSCLGASVGVWVIRAHETGSWSGPLDLRNLPWKALIALLVFGALAGVGRARRRSREAAEATARALRAEALRERARLAVLRAQLNPHFVLNVLHSLVGLAGRDPHATSAALERLGGTLQYALRVQSRGDRVPLRDELAFTREYLELERLRLGERLTTRVSADGAPLHRVVPPFVLQPLVENAVVHAVAPRARGGTVEVRIAEEGEDLVLEVDDDGTPAAEPSLAMVRRDRHGLRLLRDRLDALYAGAASLSITRCPLGGVRATLRLRGEPASPGEEAE